MQKVVNGLLANYEVVNPSLPPTSPRLRWSRRLGGVKKPLLVLPGWKSRLADWTPFANRFKNKYKIILLDLPGFGGSAKPKEDWGIYEYFEFTKQFIADLKIKKLTVLGHSFGGRIAILLAARTDLVEKLILVDAAGMEVKGLKAILLGLVKPWVRWLPQNIKNKLGSRDYRQAGAMRQTFIKIVNQCLRDELTGISAPTLVVWGERDGELSLKEAIMLHQGIKDSRLRIVWGAGHWPHQEKLIDFIGVLEEERV